VVPAPRDDAPRPPGTTPFAPPADAPDGTGATVVDLSDVADGRGRTMSLVPAPRLERLDLTEHEREIRRGDVDAYGRSERMRSAARQMYDPIYRYWFRAEWEGLEHVPTDGGALLVANHAGAIPADAPVIMHGIESELRRPVYGLAENLFRAIPYVGTMWSRLGGVPAHPDNAFRLLHDDRQLVLVFPEGTKGTGKTYRDRYKLHRFGRAGFVEIAMRSGVPVVPIAVVGNEEAMPTLFKSRRLAALLNLPYFPVTANMLAFGPLGAAVYFPAKFKIRVLPPVHFDVQPGQERYPRAQVMTESDRIRDAIQDALYEMMRARRSVWRG
jgi:1-acyl-sn-glycerol-3-phosphate acyltransferase